MPTTTTTAPPPAGEPYVVQPGDTLSDLAVRFDVTVAAIVDANRLANPRAIVSGHTLLIPSPPQPPPTTTTAVPAAAVPAPAVPADTATTSTAATESTAAAPPTTAAG